MATNKVAKNNESRNIYIPISKDNTKDYVGWINGKKFTVPRGRFVELPIDQYEVVMNTLKQDGEVAKMVEYGSRHFSNISKYL